MFKKRLIRISAEIVCTLAVTFAIGKWSIYMAYLERGYKAAGGEFCLIIMVYPATYKIIHYIFDKLEKSRTGKKISKKKKQR